MSIWMGFVVYRASVELRNDQIVKGLFRDYHPPYKMEDAWVIDPSTRSITAELTRRLGPLKVLKAPESNTPEAWLAWLKGNGVDARLSSDSAPHTLHLRFSNPTSSPELWIGRYGVDFIVFVDKVGVVQRDHLAQPTTVIELLDAEVQPW